MGGRSELWGRDGQNEREGEHETKKEILINRYGLDRENNRSEETTKKERWEGIRRKGRKNDKKDNRNK